jgi:hypothetical protein
MPQRRRRHRAGTASHQCVRSGQAAVRAPWCCETSRGVPVDLQGHGGQRSYARSDKAVDHRSPRSGCTHPGRTPAWVRQERTQRSTWWRHAAWEGHPCRVMCGRWAAHHARTAGWADHWRCPASEASAGRGGVPVAPAEWGAKRRGSGAYRTVHRPDPGAPGTPPTCRPHRDEQTCTAGLRSIPGVSARSGRREGLQGSCFRYFLEQSSIEQVRADKMMVNARGPVWHQKQTTHGIVPR